MTASTRVILALVACLPFAAARAELTTNAAVADNFIVSSSPNNSAGGQFYVTAGVDKVGGIHRGLFRFDLSGIPAGSVVTSAVFQANVEGIPSFFVNSTFDLQAVSSDWGEGAQTGNGLGAPAATGDATWMERMFNIVSWTNAGGDADAAVLASTLVTGTGLKTWSGGSLTTVVQGWVDDASRNHGLRLRTESEGTSTTLIRLGSREGADAAKLIVGFDAPPIPAPALASIAFSTNGPLTLTWTNDPSRRYDVLFSGNLPETQDWQPADTDLRASTNGVNEWTEPPYLFGPLNPANSNVYYALHAMPASPTSLPLRLDVIATNLVAPTAITHASDGSGRLFIAEQLGQIRILDAGHNLLATPFLDISAKMTNLAPSFGITPGVNPAYDERGLLGLAFHINYAANGRFFVFYSSPKTGVNINCESILAEYHVSATNADIADPESEQILLRFDKPEFNHNGGDITFGPDGYLYVPTGDGGGAGDAHPPYGNGQNVSNLLGKILRIDIDSGSPYVIPPDNPFFGVIGPRPEIFAYGFRNPWKVAFDGTNLWVADVGQDLWEEVDLVHGGGNYGWKIIEGRHAFDTSVASLLGIDIPSLEFPIHEYRHGPLGISIIGGFVYRGANYPALQGRYVFGDFSTSFGVPDGSLFYLEETRPGIWERFEFALTTDARLGRFVKAFGQGEDGELYLSSSLALGPSGVTADIRQLQPP